MNRRQFIPMLLGTAFIDVSKLNFSKYNDDKKKLEELLKCRNDINYYLKNYYTVN